MARLLSQLPKNKGLREGSMELSDAILARRVAEGDRRAFAGLVERHGDRFYRVAWQMLSDKSEAEDVVQEAFLKLWDKSALWKPDSGAAFTTWFYRIVVNLCLDRLRKKGPDLSLVTPDEIQGDPEVSADVRMIREETAQALEMAIQALPDRQKAALTLCFYEGLSNKDAADVLGVGVKALESLLMRAKEAVRTNLIRTGLLPEKHEEKGKGERA